MGSPFALKKRRTNSSIRIGSGPATSTVLFNGSAIARAAATSSDTMGCMRAERSPKCRPRLRGSRALSWFFACAELKHGLALNCELSGFFLAIASWCSFFRCSHSHWLLLTGPRTLFRALQRAVRLLVCRARLNHAAYVCRCRVSVFHRPHVSARPTLTGARRETESRLIRGVTLQNLR
jgi:hypothetical protein